jgi:hypothetical protein
MDLSETRELPAPSPRSPAASDSAGLHASPAAGPQAAQSDGQARDQCDQCGAAVDHLQRYCVVCGAHLKRANDPAARYFSRATGRAKTQRAGGRTQPAARSGGRWRGLGIALVLALIPVAAAIGVTAGRSSNNGDAKLIQALARRQPSVTVNGGPTAGAATTAAGGASTGNSSRHKVAHVKVTSAKATTAAKPKSSSGGASGTSTTSNGSVHRITGSKPTKSEEQQGAEATQKVQKSTGKNYVNSQQSLPSQVVVP